MNPVLRELGFGPDDRVAVVHADDVAMFHATVPAVDELLRGGVVTSASVMPPCRAIREAAAWRRRNPQFDVGVHLTLTCEFERVSWSPLTTPAGRHGLADEQGRFYRTVDELHRNATAEQVRSEMIAQIEMADALGLAPTHIDSHMYAGLREPYRRDYLEIGRWCGAPAFLPRDADWSDERWEPFREQQWERHAQVLFDHREVTTRAAHVDDRGRLVREVFRGLSAGLSCVLLHPAVDGEEVRDAPDWRSRVADYLAFADPQLREDVERLGVQLISYRPLQEAMRRQLARLGLPDRVAERLSTALPWDDV